MTERFNMEKCVDIEDTDWSFAAQVAPLYDMNHWYPYAESAGTIRSLARIAAQLRKHAVEFLLENHDETEAFASTARVTVTARRYPYESPEIVYSVSPVTDFDPIEFV